MCFVFSWGSQCSAVEIVVSVLCFFLGFSVFSSGESGECALFFLGFSVFSSGDSGECALFFPGVQCVQQWR